MKSNIWVPIGSMYGIFTYIYHKNQLDVGKYTIHGSLWGTEKMPIKLKTIEDHLSLLELVSS